MTSKLKTDNHNTTIADWLIIVLLVALSGYSFVFIKDVMPQGTDVKIEVDGKPVYILPLSINRTVSVNGPLGKTVIEINNGKVGVVDSPCHSKLCVHEGRISRGVIVCLPNKVLVIISGPDNKKEIDGISG